MTESCIHVNGHRIRVYSLNTVVVGTGAAGLNAADRLASFGQEDIAVVTEDINTGTSRNAGSDKQTYYKITLSGGDPDSVDDMAETLFAGQCVDGDIALCEAAMSAQCFYRLVDLGVPFPRNRYGAYVGYKTDHDERKRATSAGPYTSKMMTECLEAAVKQKNIVIYDHLQVIKILTDGRRLRGVLCLSLKDMEDPDKRYIAFNCKNVIYSTGGPAGIYSDSVFPSRHYGSTGIAFEAGVMGKNLTEWQYGLSSVNPRWNVSGSYMQVLPRFISTDKDGTDEKEFLSDYFSDEGLLLSNVFLKGYQWPFDVRKVKGGSSIIDILVYIGNHIKNRRVFLDFRDNLLGKKIDFKRLSNEAREYLEKAKADYGTPVQRLEQMNAPAISFYKDRGVDLYRDRLEIALCAQHNNGGLTIDTWWQTNLEGFFAVGEVSASHGVYRPGGSALNAGQVGSMRAAQYIAANRRGEPQNEGDFFRDFHDSITDTITRGESVFAGINTVNEIWNNATRRMSRFGAAVRNYHGIVKAAEDTRQEWNHFSDIVKIASVQNLGMAYRLYDILLCQYVYLMAMADYIENGGKSRGSALYSDKNGTCSHEGLPNAFTYSIDDGEMGDRVQEVVYEKGHCRFVWRKVREIPKEDYFFENVWRDFRANGNFSL